MTTTRTARPTGGTRLAALYLRVSTEEQAQRDHYGLDTQRADMVAYAAREGFAIRPDAVFVDDGYSGEYDERPALRRLRDLLAGDGPPPFDVVLIPCVDRLARNLPLALALHKEITRAGCEIHWRTGLIDTSTPEGVLMFQILGAFAEHEKSIILKRTRAGRLSKARKGLYAGGRPPYGYRFKDHDAVMPDERGRRRGHGKSGVLVIHEGEAATVRLIFRLAAVEQKSLRAITAELNALGLPSPRGRGAKGTWAGRWSAPGVRYMLRSPVYTGRASFCGIPTTVPAIIDDALFARAGEHLTEAKTAAAGRRPSHVYTLKGLIRCGDCGKAMVGDTAHRASGLVHRYYRCNRKDDGKPKCPRSGLVRADRLEAAVWDKVLAVFGTREGIADVLADYRASAGARDSAAKAAADTATRELADVTRRLDRYLDQFEAGDMTASPAIKARIADLETRRAALTVELARAHAVLARGNISRAQAAEFEGMADRLARTARRITDPAEQRTFLHRFVQGVMFDRSGIVVRGILTADVQETPKNRSRKLISRSSRTNQFPTVPFEFNAAPAGAPTGRP